MSLVTLAVILVGCGNNQASAANEKEDSTLLKPGTVWKDDDSTLKVIDDSTWEYTEDSPMPVSKQISVERQDDYEGLSRYKVLDSAGVISFINKPDSLFIVVPHEENNVTQMLILGSSKQENRSKEELIEYGKNISKYKLQK